MWYFGDLAILVAISTIGLLLLVRESMMMRARGP